MKKLFTLLAFMACFMGAKAEWVQDYKIEYSAYDGFPFFVMGYVPEWFDGVMTDFGAMYTYKTEAEDGDNVVGEVLTNGGGATYQKIELTEPGWHQYFIADNIPTEVGNGYTVKAMVKASEACTINVNMGWGWNSGESTGASVSIGTEWEEVEWEYSEIGGASCNLVAQPGGVTATIEWKYVIVGHNQKAQRPVTWQEWLTNDGNSFVPGEEHTNVWMGDAETQWPAWSLEETDGINANWRGNRTGEICAWALTMGRNFDDQNTAISEDSPRSRPYPADIEVEAGNETNHVFAVHVDRIEAIDAEASIEWSNQFWIQSPKGWKSGTQIKLHFRYKAEHACSAATQIHKENPSDYLHYQAIDNVNFTTEWQEFDKTITFNGSQDGGWSVAFNLCSDATNGRTPNVFYFDDLSWQTMVLDEGYFVAGANPDEGLEYDFDNAVQFVDEEGAGLYTATIGAKNEYVSQVMISTIRGNDAAFKGATLKPNSAVTFEDGYTSDWIYYTAGSLAKITLPGSGIWKISIYEEYNAMQFEMIEGNVVELPEINPNPTVVVVKGQERDYLSADGNGNPREDEIGTGEAWDNQFFIVANRTLSTGEETILEFDYVSTVDAKTSTQCHGAPGAYKHWGAIGDVNFTTEEQHFSQTFTVPSEANEMQSIAFNMAEIKGACDYTIKNVVWKLADGTQSLIDQTGSKNFYVKEGAGTDPYQFGTDPAGVNSVVNSNKVSTVTYNLAGQRVSKDYKGIVVKNGTKVVNK